MPSKKGAAQFSRYQDIVMYAATASEPFTVTDLVNFVSELNRANVRIAANQLVHEGYLTVVYKRGNTLVYEATELARNLYGQAELRKLKLLESVVKHLAQGNKISSVFISDTKDAKYFNELIGNI